MDKIKKQSEFVRVMKQMSKNKLAILGLIILLTEFVLVLLAPVIAPYDYAYTVSYTHLTLPTKA